MAPPPDPHAPRLAPTPVRLGSYWYVSDLFELAKYAPPALPRCPPVTVGKTIVFAMEKPASWDVLDSAGRWELKKSYLKTSYSATPLWFEEDGELPDSATPQVHIPKHDYYARFEVVEHPNCATQFTSSMILLELGGLAGLPAALKIVPPPVVAPVNTPVAAPETVKPPVVAPVNTPTAAPITVPATTPVDTPTLKLALTPRQRVPPAKYVRLAHRDVATSVVTFARAAMYKRVKGGGVVKRKLCVNYTRRA